MQTTIGKILVCIAVLPFLLCVQANDEVLRLSGSNNYWAHPARNYSNWRYSELDQINNKNAGKLQVAWMFSTGSLNNHTGGPLVLPAGVTGLDTDMLFLHTPYPNAVLAISLEDYKLVWRYEAESSDIEGQCCGGENFGLSYGDGKLFLQQNNMTLVAIHARNGKVAWKTRNTTVTPYQPLVNAPYVVNNFVLTGTVNVNNNGGSIASYRTVDGGLVWQAIHNGTAKEVLLSPATTSLGKPVIPAADAVTWQKGKGLTTDFPWLSIAWDRQQNLIYYGSGNSALIESGPQRWTSSIIAREADTGVARWVYRISPAAKWGYAGNNEMILANIKVKGRSVPALIHFAKNGFAYVLNRITGELVSAEKYDPVTNWASRIDLSNGMPVYTAITTEYLCPALTGSKAEQPAAFSPRTGLFYIPASNTCMTTTSAQTEMPVAGSVSREESISERIEVMPAGRVVNDGSENMGKLLAWSADKGEVKWQVPEQWPVKSGVLATAGDVVFYGTLDGYVRLVDAKTGKLLWQFKVPSGVTGNFVTWMYKDKQYVGVLTGVTPDPNYSVDGLYGRLQKTIRAGGTLMVFSLP